MVNEALDSYLQNYSQKNSQKNSQNDSQDNLQNDSQKDLQNDSPNDSALLQCKILDPACGSGAFPCGVMNEIMRRIDPDKKLTQQERYHKKLEILKKVIYCVDIQSMAVQISSLRFFLALIQEIIPDKKKDNYGIEPLPNLETKFICANALVSLTKEKEKLQLQNIKTIVKQLQLIREQHLVANTPQDKKRLQGDDKNLRKLLSAAMEDAGDLSHETAELLLRWNPYDQTKSTPFFDPHWMFGIEDGFDIVIGNPPYVVLSSNFHNIEFFHSHYRCGKGGKVNLYKLFFEKGLKLLKQNGILTFITPNTFISSKDSVILRQILLENQIKEIIEYAEKDKIFEHITQAVAITLVMVKDEKDYYFKHVKSGIETILSSKIILQNKGLFFKGTNSIIEKIKKQNQKFDSIIFGWQGEINVSTKKENFIAQEKNGYLPLIRGNQIEYYQIINKPVEFCPIIISNRNHYKLKRIVFQEVANAGLERRIKATILENVLCGHTTNYCFPKNKDYSLEYILGLLNSKILNYWFKYYNQTNHVPIGEIKQIPVPVTSSNKQQPIITLVNKIYSEKSKNPNADTIKLESKIDRLVYELYDLTEDEIKIIEG
jgi:hypothetical protein